MQVCYSIILSCLALLLATDPVTGSERHTATDGSIATWQEFVPLGNDVPKRGWLRFFTTQVHISTPIRNWRGQDTKPW